VKSCPAFRAIVAQHEQKWTNRGSRTGIGFPLSLFTYVVKVSRANVGFCSAAEFLLIIRTLSWNICQLEIRIAGHRAQPVPVRPCPPAGAAYNSLFKKN
jgi:hypothetical protein